VGHQDIVAVAREQCVNTIQQIFDAVNGRRNKDGEFWFGFAHFTETARRVCNGLRTFCELSSQLASASGSGLARLDVVGFDHFATHLRFLQPEEDAVGPEDGAAAGWGFAALQGLLPEVLVGAALRRDTEFISPPGVGGGRG
jgi:hypothetical protein